MQIIISFYPADAELRMDMTQYLDEIEHAATEVIALVWSERKILQSLTQTIKQDTNEMAAGYSSAEFLALNPDLDDENLGTGIHRDTYFGPDKDQRDAGEKKIEIEAILATRAFSTAVLSGSVLQFGKQGISLVHGGLSSSPAGRPVESQFLRDVIWQGRNHALHWEEGTPHLPVRAC